jgi:hypothetical protein
VITLAAFAAVTSAGDRGPRLDKRRDHFFAGSSAACPPTICHLPPRLTQMSVYRRAPLA